MAYTWSNKGPVFIYFLSAKRVYYYYLFIFAFLAEIIIQNKCIFILLHLSHLFYCNSVHLNLFGFTGRPNRVLENNTYFNSSTGTD